MVYYGISVSLFLCHQPSVLLRRQNIAPRLKPRCNILSPQQNFRLMTKITLQKFHNIPYISTNHILSVLHYVYCFFVVILATVITQLSPLHSLHCAIVFQHIKTAKQIGQYSMLRSDCLEDASVPQLYFLEKERQSFVLSSRQIGSLSGVLAQAGLQTYS